MVHPSPRIQSNVCEVLKVTLICYMFFQIDLPFLASLALSWESLPSQVESALEAKGNAA